ncbi:MAG TPA: TrbI/VirB10 family protein, partial [Stellaceae bacterium]|nr:TrbI/VirB10 family protein [Stellaceae bacterium]
MTAELQEPARRPDGNADDGVSAVAGARPRLSAGQKLGIIAGAGAIALATIVLTHLPGGTAKPSDMADNTGGIGALGIPFSAPPDTSLHKPKASLPAAPPLPAPHPSPLMATLLNHQETPAEQALKSPILAYGSASGAPAPASSTAKGGGGAVPLQGRLLSRNDPLARDLTPSDLGMAATARILAHPDYTIAAGTIIPCTLQTAIDSGLPGFVKCVLPQAVRGMTGRVTLLDRGTQVLGEIRAGLVEGQDRLFILWTRAVTPNNVAIAL